MTRMEGSTRREVNRPVGRSGYVTHKEHHVDLLITGLLCFVIGFVVGCLYIAIT